MDKKFLSDGRKVAILGKLNNIEWIVQEIFVSANGDEIPSGESFTTKSLHDVPVESYYKREEKLQKQGVEKAKLERERIGGEIKKLNSLLRAKKDMLANSPELNALFGDKTKIISMFMTGTVNYLVIDHYKLSKPIKMEDNIIQWGDCYYGERSYEALKLCSILGKSGGNLEYRIHQYSDGSGSSSQEVHPFETLEEAVNKIKELAIAKLEKDHFYEDDFTVCKELKIEFTDAEKGKILKLLSASLQSAIDSNQKSIDANSKDQSKLKEKLAALKADVLGETS